MAASLLLRIRAAIAHFIRTHVVADEKDLWPNYTALELHELETAPLRLGAVRR